LDNCTAYILHRKHGIKDCFLARRVPEVREVHDEQPHASSDVATTLRAPGFSGMLIGIPFLFAGIKWKNVKTITSEVSPRKSHGSSSPEIPSVPNLTEPQFDVDSDDAVDTVESHDAVPSHLSGSGPSVSSILSTGISEAPVEDD
ncbi:unnamed protein product, partial [Allacma fusca]